MTIDNCPAMWERSTNGIIVHCQLSIDNWKAVVSICQNVKRTAWECPWLHQNTDWWPGRPFSRDSRNTHWRYSRRFLFFLFHFPVCPFPSVGLFTWTDAISHIENHAPSGSKKWGQVVVFVRTRRYDGADTSVRWCGHVRTKPIIGAFDREKEGEGCFFYVRNGVIMWIMVYFNAFWGMYLKIFNACFSNWDDFAKMCVTWKRQIGKMWC